VPFYSQELKPTMPNVPVYVATPFHISSSVLIDKTHIVIPNLFDDSAITIDEFQFTNLGNYSFPIESYGQPYTYGITENPIYSDSNGLSTTLEIKNVSIDSVLASRIIVPNSTVEVGQVFTQKITSTHSKLPKLTRESLTSFKKEFIQKAYITTPQLNSYTEIIQLPKYKLFSIPLDDFVNVRVLAEPIYNYNSEDSDFYYYVWTPETHPLNSTGTIFQFHFSYEYFFDINRAFIVVIFFILGVVFDRYFGRKLLKEK
jgi:hypothetical protein